MSSVIRRSPKGQRVYVETGTYELPRCDGGDHEWRRYRNLDLMGASEMVLWAEHQCALLALATLVRADEDVPLGFPDEDVTASEWLYARVMFIGERLDEVREARRR